MWWRIGPVLVEVGAKSKIRTRVWNAEEMKGFMRLGALRRGEAQMCDYSLHSVATRPAKVGDRLVTRDFGTGTCGFAAPENSEMAVCLRPGTELAFVGPVTYCRARWLGEDAGIPNDRTAIFRQINVGIPHRHHDALEFPTGKVVLLTTLCLRQEAVVLQLPAEPAHTLATASEVPTTVLVG
jgi:hypothetical protein